LDRGNRGLAIGFRHTQRRPSGYRRSGDEGGDKKGESGAHEKDYWASLREGWVC